MILNIGGGGGLPIRLIVTAPTGSAVSVTQGTTVLAANEVDGVWTFAIPSLGIWTIHATIDGQSLTQDVDISKVGQYNVTLEKPVKTTLNDNDWATIKIVADESKGANYWAVGDTKQITINGKLSDGLTLSNYETWVYIIGFDHNSEREGAGIAFQGFKTAQTGGTDICLCDSGYGSYKNSGQWFNMNNSGSNYGGWNGCNMRNNTLPVVKSALPSDLQAVIKTTTLYTDNTGNGSDVASYVTPTQDTLYLLAEFETFGARRSANSAERNYQQQYAYYVAGNSRIKYKHNSTATAALWWERSVLVTNIYNFCIVGVYGDTGTNGAELPYGLAPAFKVGSTTISALSVGSSVYCNVNGVKTEFIVVNQGKPSAMYDDSCNGTWLLMKDIYENRVWDSSNIEKYESSDINAYLNNTFLNLFDSNIKDAVKQVKIPYRKNGGPGGTDQSGANGLSCKIFLLSGYEVGWTTSDNGYFPVDGVKLSYFESGTGTSANNKRIANLNGSAAYWWNRSPYTGETNFVWYVNIDGNYNNLRASGFGGVRPCIILPSDTLVSVDGTIQS